MSSSNESLQMYNSQVGLIMHPTFVWTDNPHARLGIRLYPTSIKPMDKRARILLPIISKREEEHDANNTHTLKAFLSAILCEKRAIASMVTIPRGCRADSLALHAPNTGYVAWRVEVSGGGVVNIDVGIDLGAVVNVDIL